MNRASDDQFQRKEPDSPSNGIPLRSQPVKRFCCLDNEASEIFQPIIGAAAFAIYAGLLRKAIKGPEVSYTTRRVAAETSLSTTTVWRELRVLEHVGMVRLRAGGGNRDSICQFLDLKELAKRKGASESRMGSLVLSKSISEREKANVEVIRKQLQGKKNSGPEVSVTQNSSNLRSPGSRRDASVSPENLQSPAGETQTGLPILEKNKRQEDSLSPTPSHVENCMNLKSPTKKECLDKLLDDARNLFTGVIDGMRNHLLSSCRPRRGYLADGFADWKEFAFDTLALKAVTECSGVLTLTISSLDPVASRRGLSKYHRTWEVQLQKWFGCKTYVVIS